MLDSLNRFKVLVISETRVCQSSISNHNVNLPGYSFLSTPTESSAGGTALYIANYLKFNVRDDLSSSLYLAKSVESTFAELSPENQTNVIVGCISIPLSQ